MHAEILNHNIQQHNRMASYCPTVRLRTAVMCFTPSQASVDTPHNITLIKRLGLNKIGSDYHCSPLYTLSRNKKILHASEAADN